MFETDHRDLWFATHILPHEGRLKQWLRRFPSVEPEDIIQEAYAVLAECDIASIQNPRAFFFTVARNLVFQALRRASIVPINALADFSSDAIVDTNPIADQVVSARQEVALLERAIALLPERCRQVFVLRRVYGCSQKECAQRLGMTAKVVEKQLARALALMGKAYEEGAATPHDEADASLAWPTRHVRH